MIRINQIKLPYNHSSEDLLKVIGKQLKLKDSALKNIQYKIVKRSIDSRKKPNIFYVYAVDVNLIDESNIIKKVNNKNIMLINDKKYSFPTEKNFSNVPSPVIVGMGPAGLFCGLCLAKAGLNPIIIERGECVEKRVETVEVFWRDNKLNTSSNVQFGEGGAGTFSDGKLNTMVKDTTGRIRYCLEQFVKFGANEDILYVNKPHIGTDVLCEVVKNIRNEIIHLGGKVMFNTQLTDIFVENSSIKGIEVNYNQRIDCSTLVLALGHSARDTFSVLKKRQVEMKAKSFAVGVRIEHSQKVINKYSYGIENLELHEGLPVADYKVTHQCSNGRGVYSFCMCPGGYVVNASSEEGHLAINGMSYSGRDSNNANSAMIVTVNPEDFKSDDVLCGMEFQRELEKKAYSEGNGVIPIQTYKDYKNNVCSSKLGEIIPCIKGQYAFGNINNIFPDFINDAIKEGIEAFENQIEGFSNGDAVISGVESRTSSPVRILRDDETFESNIKGLYPCGEGAGYAGGITSACVDGIKVAEKIYQHL